MRLFGSIAESIVFNDKLPWLSFGRLSSPTRKAILKYVTQPTVAL